MFHLTSEDMTMTECKYVTKVRPKRFYFPDFVHYVYVCGMCLYVCIEINFNACILIIQVICFESTSIVHLFLLLWSILFFLGLTQLIYLAAGGSFHFLALMEIATIDICLEICFLFLFGNIHRRPQ